MYNWGNNNTSSNNGNKFNFGQGQNKFDGTNQQKPLQLGFSGTQGSTNGYSGFNSPLPGGGFNSGFGNTNTFGNTGSSGFNTGVGGSRFGTGFTPSGNTQQTENVFGNSSKFGTNLSGTTGFGSSNFTSTGFGNASNQTFNSNINKFGASSTTGGFNTTGSTFGSSFGQPNTTSTASFGQFSTNASSTAFPQFNSSTSPGSSQFGAPTQPFSFANNTSPPFGSTPSQFNTQQNTTPFSSNTSNYMSNRWNIGSVKGTKAVNYCETRIKEDGLTVALQDITGMQTYKEKSLDELRKEDYEEGRKHTTPNATNETLSTTVNKQSTMPTNTTSLFNTSTPSQSSFSTTNPFGTNSVTSANPFLPSSDSKTTNPQNNPFASPLSQPSGAPPISAPQNSFTAPQSTQNPFSEVKPPNPFSSTNIFNTTTSTMSQPQVAHPFGTTSTGNASTTFQPAASPFATTMNTFVQTPTNNDDPYLLKNIQFPESLTTMPSYKLNLPKPVFDNKPVNSTKIDITIRPPRKYVQKNIYTIPDNIVDGTIVNQLIIGFENKGRIEYLEPVTFNKNSLSSIVINGTDVIINDNVGTGYNKRAKVYIEGVYAYSRGSRTYLQGKQDTWPNKGIQERFIYQLKSDINKKFIDYDEETGVYVYEVNHF